MSVKVAVHSDTRQKFAKDLSKILIEMSKKDISELRNRDEMAIFYVDECEKLMKRFDKVDPTYDAIESCVLEMLEYSCIMLRFVK